MSSFCRLLLQVKMNLNRNFITTNTAIFISIGIGNRMNTSAIKDSLKN